MSDILDIKKPKEYELKNFFERNGITQRNIAVALGYTRGNVSHWMSGHIRIPDDVERKFRKTAIFLSSNHKVISTLTKAEVEYCKKD